MVGYLTLTLESSNTFATAPINSRVNVLARSPIPFEPGQMVVGLPHGPSYPGHSPSTNHFLLDRSDLPFHLAASSAILKPDGPLKWKAVAFGRSSLLLISRKLFTLSGIPPFTTNSFRLFSLDSIFPF